MFRLLSLAFAIGIAVALTGCQTSPNTQQKKDNLRDTAQVTLRQFQQTDPGLQEFMNNAAGYAIFPSVGKGGLIVGGAYGRGAVYQGGDLVGYSDLTQASIGLQLGGQTFAELIVFENEEALNRFKSGNFAFSANASAVAIKSGASAAARYENGVAVFTRPNGGAMFEASVGGQKFGYVSASDQ